HRGHRQRPYPNPTATPSVFRREHSIPVSHPPGKAGLRIALRPVSVEKRKEAAFKLGYGLRHARVADGRKQILLKLPARLAVLEVLGVAFFQSIEHALAHVAADAQHFRECGLMLKHGPSPFVRGSRVKRCLSCRRGGLKWHGYSNSRPSCSPVSNALGLRCRSSGRPDR